MPAPPPAIRLTAAPAGPFLGSTLVAMVGFVCICCVRGGVGGDVSDGFAACALCLSARRMSALLASSSWQGSGASEMGQIWSFGQSKAQSEQQESKELRSCAKTEKQGGKTRRRNTTKRGYQESTVKHVTTRGRRFLSRLKEVVPIMITLKRTKERSKSRVGR